MTLKTRSVYEPRHTDDGVRILVTRFWPRGMKRSICDEWLRELAPSAELLGRYRRGKMSWYAYTIQYRAGLGTGAARRAMLDIRSRAASQNVTLLCYELEGGQCHRHILCDVIAD